MVVVGVFVTLLWGKIPELHIPRLIRPVTTLDQVNLPSSPLASFARKLTAEDSVFLVPPNLGSWRLLAHRAIVVDFKVFPFQDGAMAEWYERMLDCYGSPHCGGFSGCDELDNQYRRITEEQMLETRRKYGATHAVLYSETPCDMPVLFQDALYKVVRIESSRRHERNR